MPRQVLPEVAAATRAELVTPIYLAELDFSGGFVRVTTAPFDVQHEGNTYIGVGQFGGISGVEETVEGRASQITLFLSGVDLTLVSIALDQEYQGRAGKLWKAYLDEDESLIGEPIFLFQGLMDVMPISLQSQEAVISLTVVSRFTKWENPVNQPRWDNADHQLRHPGDRFFEFVAEVTAGKEIIWGGGGSGAPPANVPPTGGSGGAPRGKIGG